jgi:Flp pilus assembly pilin Flp
MKARWWSRLCRRVSLLVRADGQVVLEYALVLALLAIGSIAVLRALGIDLGHLVSESSSRMSTVRNP